MTPTITAGEGWVAIDASTDGHGFLALGEDGMWTVLARVSRMRSVDLRRLADAMDAVSAGMWQESPPLPTGETPTAP